MNMAFEPSELIPRPDTSEVNQQGVEFARKEIKKYCTEIVDIVYQGVSLYLDADKELSERLDALLETVTDEDGQVVETRLPKGEVFGVFVRQDGMLTAPKEDGEYVKTFCTRIEHATADDSLPGHSNPDSAPVEENAYMKIHVPVGQRSIHDFEMPEPYEVDRVFVQLVDADDVRWYAIEKSGLVYEYIPDIYQSDELVDAHTDRGLRELLNPGVPETHRLVTDLLEYIIDGKTVPQQVRTIK